ncbi:tRNA preQ1(34) S-adenosylmethionine ribosyltransferase-isomerase QueA [Candidatus Dojkabacteria bacterium CG_4_10_14_0_2_um_filter_Dojkabacteria_WS6_41_15]|uniref:tRNA preQ1(34) S-adenosylmethionine ribosyltransferase-isomerase QueA n=1 Tax=Candidatus Dojkabacteria bacterium CG_4_10_14_0_2_um_filter_Dojkabacteria_WS6_41_15 TaxID=2014249 RepID=A0A2M7W3N7_9BACT|nr:MAG: tRNA preQ1(34) S-adenosylmethionine ribosyltransferase-isomerase QueA [Candidatus Dojkabacteria bacterium CG_4_10_14_0_2_um_filter_Dojkabacteria_WS6_41_15]
MKESMNLSDYDYQFPQDAIAMYPPEKRGTTKLFVVNTQTGEIEIDQYENLDKHLTAQDVLVRNITKVFHARLFGMAINKTGQSGKQVEVFFTEPHAQSLEEYARRQYDPKEKGYKLEFLTALRGIRLDSIRYIDFGDNLRLKKISKNNDSLTGILYKTDSDFSVEELFTMFEQKGKVPLPPYIKRSTVVSDDERYQTIFAEKLGSVAAPTASLNFTKTLEARLAKQGTAIAEVTLHVGRGTFMPLRHERIEDNILHSEPYFVKNSTITALHLAKQDQKRIIAMGTTTTRTLESIAPQILDANTSHDILSETKLFVYPPFRFKIVDGLLTNFHFPRSSLITLVDAFLQYKRSKLSWRTIYEFAMKNEARLFSYGDSMLIL